MATGEQLSGGGFPRGGGLSRPPATCHGPPGRPRARSGEGGEEPRNEQKHFTQRRKAAESAKRTKELSYAGPCALAPLREIVYLLKPTPARGTKSSRLNNVPAPSAAKHVSTQVKTALGGQPSAAETQPQAWVGHPDLYHGHAPRAASRAGASGAGPGRTLFGALPGPEILAKKDKNLRDCKMVSAPG